VTRGAPRAGLEIAAWGARTPVGLDASQTGFALRAGVTRVRETLFADRFGDPVRMALLDALADDCSGFERLASLAVPAACEAAERIAERAPQTSVALLLAVDPGVESNALLERVRDAVHPICPVVHADAIAGGGSSGAVALEGAAEWLRTGADLVLLGGVHSDYDWPRLRAALAADRVIDAENLEGFIPGEGAAFVALCRGGGAERLERDAGARVSGWSHISGDPDVHPLVPQPDRLARALERAAAPVRGRRVNAWTMDLTHEQTRLREIQILFARLGDLVGERVDFNTPLRELGRLGAATLPTFWVLAAEAWVRGYAADDVAVCLAGSDDGARAAVLLEAAEG
jgi:3-oxoacyl-[acyl-carrier-protein] synthase I